MKDSAKMNNLKRRVWVEIDVSRLRANYAKIAAAVKPLKVLCVLKANAYGLGVMPYAAALAETDCAGFGVAEPFEALQLAGGKKPVQILSSILPDEIEPMVAAGVTLPVIDLPTAKLISAAARKLGRTATVHFKLDTGMGRLGILAADAPRVIRAVKRLPNLDCAGIFSHCPMAYDPANEFSNDQIDLFCAILKDVARDGIRFKTIHIAASDAINNFPRAAASTCTAPSTPTDAARSTWSRSSPSRPASPRSATSPPAPRSATDAPGASRSARAWRRSPPATRTVCPSPSRTAATC